MEPLRAGLIGCGSIGRLHAETLEAIGEEVAAVADVDPTALESFADDFDVSETYEDYERMIDDAALDLVVVAVPNSLHADCAIAALRADLDVFVEKPLAATLEGARRIESAARESAGDLMVGFVKAFEPAFEDARDRAVDGEFGTVYDVDVEYVRRRGIPQLGSWFTSKDAAGGGALIDAGVHALHLALTILDFPEMETVSAATGSHFGTKDDYTYLSMWGGDPLPDAEFTTEDYVRGLVRTADGATLHLHCAWAGNTDPRKSVRVQGSEAGMTIEEGSAVEPTLYSTDRGALTDTDLEHPDEAIFENQWAYFASVVRGERDHTRNTLEEGLAVQRLVAAMYESAADDREVSLVDRSRAERL